MKFRLYAASMIGVGTRSDPWRNIIFDYIDTSIGEKLSVYDNNNRMFSLCMLQAEDATHTTVLALTEVTLLSLLASTLPELVGWLDSDWSDLSQAARDTAVARLETDGGISMAWIGSGNSLRQVFRYALQMHNINQRMRGEHKDQAIAFLQANLATEVKDVSPAIRNDVKDWMQNKGLAIGWITSSTTVRQVTHYIINNLGIGSIKLFTRQGDKVEF